MFGQSKMAKRSQVKKPTKICTLNWAGASRKTWVHFFLTSIQA